MHKLLIYTFFNWNKLSFKIVRDIEGRNISKLYVSGRNGADRLVKHILNIKYEYVLGLGDFRKDSKNIRIETRFINKYGRDKIVQNGAAYIYSNWKLDHDEKVIEKDSVSTGPCNKSAYLVGWTINENNLHTKFSFVHIPRSLDKDYVQDVILGWTNSVL